MEIANSKKMGLIPVRGGSCDNIRIENPRTYIISTQMASSTVSITILAWN